MAILHFEQARLIQTAALVQNGVLPLFFKNTLIDKYQKAIVSYYETGNYTPYVSFFNENYAQVISEFMGDDYLNTETNFKKTTPKP